MSDEQHVSILDMNFQGECTRFYERLIRFMSEMLIASGLPLYLLSIEDLEVVLKAIEIVLARVVQVLNPFASFLSIFNFLNVSC